MKEIEQYAPVPNLETIALNEKQESLKPFVPRAWWALFLMLWAVKNKIKG